MILVIALLTLPAAIAVLYLRSLLAIMLLAAVLGIAFTSGGLALSYAPDLPAGATMIVLAGATYLVALATRGLLTHYQRAKQTGARRPTLPDDPKGARTMAGAGGFDPVDFVQLLCGNAMALATHVNVLETDRLS